VYVDLDAQKIDACYVDLLGVEHTVNDVVKEGWTYERLWAETLRTAALLRQQVSNPLPASVFVPYVEVTLTDSDRAAARVGLLTACAVGCVEQELGESRADRDSECAMSRVHALGQAVDYLAVLRPRQGKVCSRYETRR
jgi:hypothetical protein